MTVTVKLSKAIEDAGKTYTELTFREAELGDLIAADHMQGELGKTAAVIAGMAGVPLPAIRKLSMRDMNKIMKAVEPLMGNEPEPETGD